MEYTSDELKNASFAPPSITYTEPVVIDAKNLKEEIKTAIFLKDRKLLAIYDSASMNRGSSSSGNETLKSLLRLIRDHFTNKYKEDNIKNLTVRKNFDILTLVLDSLLINNIDCSSDEVNTLILGFITKTFL